MIKKFKPRPKQIYYYISTYYDSENKCSEIEFRKKEYIYGAKLSTNVFKTKEQAIQFHEERRLKLQIQYCKNQVYKYQELSKLMEADLKNGIPLRNYNDYLEML